MKNFYKSNTFLAIVSVICAIIIWIYVVYEVNPLYEVWIKDVPVQTVNASSLFDDGSLVLVGDNSDILKGTKTVDVKIKGKRNIVSSVSKKDISCTLDMITITRSGIYTIKPDMQIVKSGVEIVKTTPYSIKLAAENIEQKDIKVTVKQNGKVDGGYSVANIKNHNETIKITGPSSIINKVGGAEAVIDLGNIDSKVTEVAAPIEFYDIHGNKIESIQFKKTVNYAKISFDLYNSKEVSVIIMPKYKSEVNKNSRGEIVKLSVDGEGNQNKNGGLEVKVKIKGSSASLEKYAESVREVYTEEIDVSNVLEDRVFEDVLAAALSGNVEYDVVPKVKVKAVVEKN